MCRNNDSCLDSGRNQQTRRELAKGCSFQPVSKSGKQIRNETTMHQMRLKEIVGRYLEYKGIQVKEEETETLVYVSP